MCTDLRNCSNSTEERVNPTSVPHTMAKRILMQFPTKKELNGQNTTPRLRNTTECRNQVVGGSEYVTSRDSQKPGSLNPILTKCEILMSYNILRAFLVTWVDHIFWNVLK
jgi:hypothetical protein